MILERIIPQARRVQNTGFRSSAEALCAGIFQPVVLLGGGMALALFFFSPLFLHAIHFFPSILH